MLFRAFYMHQNITYQRWCHFRMFIHFPSSCIQFCMISWSSKNLIPEVRTALDLSKFDDFIHLNIKGANYLDLFLIAPVIIFYKYLKLLLRPYIVERDQKLFHNLSFPIFKPLTWGLEISSFEFNPESKIQHRLTDYTFFVCCDTFSVDESYFDTFCKILSFLSCDRYFFWGFLNLKLGSFWCRLGLLRALRDFFLFCSLHLLRVLIFVNKNKY